METTPDGGATEKIIIIKVSSVLSRVNFGYYVFDPKVQILSQQPNALEQAEEAASVLLRCRTALGSSRDDRDGTALD